MKNKCEIIRDLFPLYLENLCGDASKQCVEEHIAECQECKKLLDTLKADVPSEPVNIPSDETVLKRTAWKISRQAIMSSVAVTAIVIFWLIYLWQDNLSNYGDYRYFSYGFNEVCVVVAYYLVPLLTVIWFLHVFIRTIRRKTWRKNIVIIVVLALLLVVQAGYFYQQSQTVTTFIPTEVVEVPDAYHIVIMNGEQRITLETTPIVTELLQGSDSRYGFIYQWSRQNPAQGTLIGIRQIVGL